MEIHTEIQTLSLLSTAGNTQRHFTNLYWAQTRNVLKSVAFNVE